MQGFMRRRHRADWTDAEIQVLNSISWRGGSMIASQWAWKFMDTSYLKLNTFQKVERTRYTGTFYTDGYSVCPIFQRVEVIDPELDFELPYVDAEQGILLYGL